MVKVFQALASAIAGEGVVSAFGLVGQANMHLVAELGAHGVTVYHSLHEGTALGMAEGYRRASGRPTVCLVTGGAAMVNLSLSVVEAVRSQTPLIIVTGRTPPLYRGSPQTFDHRTLAGTLGAGYEEITAAGHVGPITRAAFLRADRERRPIVLDVASDLQLAELPGEFAYRPAADNRVVAAAPAASEASLREAAAFLARVQRPVLIAGAGAVSSGAHAEIIALGERIGALMATTLPAHGWLADDAFNIGVAGMFAWPFALDLLRDADCVIGIGASLNRYTMQDTGSATGALSFDAARTIQISLDSPAPIGDDHDPAVFVRGDARAAAAGLLELIPRVHTGYRTAEVASALAEQRSAWDPVEFPVEPDRVDPRVLCELLEAQLPTACGLTVGTGHCWSFPIMHMRRWYEPQLFAYHFGSIGVASAIGLGASIGAPDRPMVVVEGDGSVLMNTQNFAALARYRLPLLLVVLNDDAYGAELHQLAGRGLDGTVSLLPPTDIAAVAQAFGVTAATVRSLDDLGTALKDFLANPRPFVLDCRVSRSVISVPSRRLDYGDR